MVLGHHPATGAGEMAVLCTAQLLADLGVTQSLGPPGSRTTTLASEAHFKTFKYHPGFPDRFGSIADAKNFCREFFQWHSTEHRHGGIGLLTPQQVHFGRAPEVIEHRQNVLAAAYAARPDRFVCGPPRAAELAEEVWINRALTVTPVDGSESANGGKDGSLD